MPAKTTGWTAAGVAPTVFTAADNWDNGVAVDGDTIDIKSDQAPNTLRPATGTFNFVVASALTVTPINWLNGAGIGAVTVNHASAVVTCNAALGAVVVTAGKYIQPGFTGEFGSVFVAAGAFLETLDHYCYGNFTNHGVVLLVSDTSSTIDGNLINTGTMQRGGPGIPVITVFGLTTNSGTIEAELDCEGGLDSTGGKIIALNLLTVVGVLSLGTTSLYLDSNLALVGLVVNFGTAAIFATGANKTIDGTGATSIAASGCDIFANAQALTVKAMPANVRTWNGCTDGGGNAAAVAFNPGTPDDV